MTCSRCTSWARRPGSCSRAAPSIRSSIRSFEGWPRERHDQLKGELVARGPAAAGRPALPAARPVPLRARRRRALRAHRLGRHLSDRHGRRQLRVRAHGRRGGRPRQPAARPGRAAGPPGRDRRSAGAASWPSRRRSTTCAACAAASAGRARRYDLPGLIERAEEAFRVKARGPAAGRAGRAGTGWSRRARARRSRCRRRCSRMSPGCWRATGSRKRELAAAFPAADAGDARSSLSRCRPDGAGRAGRLSRVQCTVASTRQAIRWNAGRRLRR